MGAVIQGIVQGLTEFLPISSSGHLEVFSKVFGFRGDLSFVALLHLGTFFAVFIFAFKKLVFAFKKPWVLFMLFISTLPAVIFGMLFEDVVEKSFNAEILPITFSITAFFLLIGSVSSGRKKMEEMSWIEALLIGFAQLLALFPGISRSGMTISAALLLGYTFEDALYYSFLMALPVTLGAGILKFQGAGTPGLVGLVFSFLFGLLALFLLKKSVYLGKLHVYGYYLVGVSLVSFLWG